MYRPPDRPRSHSVSPPICSRPLAVGLILLFRCCHVQRLRQAAVNLRTATENPTRQLVPPGFAWPACQVNVVEPTVPTCTTAPPPAEAIASSDASVCESVKGLPPTHSGTCVVCLAGPVEVLGASWLHPDEAMEGMVTNPTACQVSGCLECLKTYFEVKK